MSALHRPQRMEGYQLEVLDDELLLYHPTETRAIYMNETATIVWGACDGRTIEDIVEMVSAAFPDAPSSLPDEVRATVDQLAEFGAVREFRAP